MFPFPLFPAAMLIKHTEEMLNNWFVWFQSQKILMFQQRAQKRIHSGNSYRNLNFIFLLKTTPLVLQGKPINPLNPTM